MMAQRRRHGKKSDYAQIFEVFACQLAVKIGFVQILLLYYFKIK